MRRWLAAHPFAVCWFAMAWCIGFTAWDVIDHRWIAAASVTLCALFNGWVIWRGKRRMRRTDAIIAEMERRSAEMAAHMRAVRAAAHTRNPEGQ
jgi:ABC-type nickel/cobalt efflux system permease component RcnA